MKKIRHVVQSASPQSKAEYQRVLQELQISQEELRTQNEELRETQQLLEASRDRYADLYDFAPIGCITLDPSGNIREINLTAAVTLGPERARLLGMPFGKYVARGDLKTYQDHLKQCHEGLAPVTTELTLAMPDTDPIQVQLHSVPLHSPVFEDQVYRTVITDITDRRRAEEALREVHDKLEDRVRERTAELAGAVEDLRKEIIERKQAEQSLRERTEELANANEILRNEIHAHRQTENALRKLTIRHLKVGDEERRRIARELHDTTGQNLVALAMNLSIINKSSETLAAHARKALAESLLLLGMCSREIRTVSYLLHPPLLDELGLAPALRWFAEGFTQRSGIRVDLEVSPRLQRLDDNVEITLFRIVQESLTNVHRHSGSPSARIRLSSDQESARLEVQDDGKGLPAALAKGTPYMLGVGVTGMHERVKQLGGRMDIESDSQGTKIRVILPISGAVQ